MLIQIYNKGHVKTNAYNTTDLKETIELADKDIYFTMPLSCIGVAENEGYIRTKQDEYVIKTVKPNKTSITIEAVLNLENLQGKPWENFSSVEQTIDDCVKLAIAGTGWNVIASGLKKKRTIRKSGTDALAIIKQCLKTYICEVEFDTINKTIHFVEKRGSNKGSYAMEDFNNTAIALDSNSDKFYTYIIAYGKAGKDQIHCTIENHQYSNKMIGLYWKDERYTVLEDLKADATYKLNELSKPRKSYSVEADFFDKNIEIGDTIKLISKEKNIKESQRVTKIVRYHDELGKDTIEVANTMLSFEDIQKEQQETQETVSNITEDNGTISINAMQDGYVELSKVNVQELNAIKANIGELKAGEVIANLLHANIADIEKLYTNKADIDDLNASNITFGTASGGTLDLQTLLAQFISGKNAELLHLTSANVTIDEAVINYILAHDIIADNVKSGTLNTNNVNIESKDGSMALRGSVLQFKDKAGNVRIQMGLDGNKVYSISIYNANGDIQWDSNGATGNGINNGAIVDTHIADNANINGKKIDIQSLVSEINNGTTTIKASKVYFDSTKQTAEVAFKELKENTDNSIETVQNITKTTKDSVDNLIKKTTITKDGKEVKLEDSYSDLYKDTYGIKSTVSSMQTDVSSAKEKATNAQSSVEQLANTVKTKVSQSDIDKLQTSANNLIKNSNFANNFDYWTKASDGNKSIDTTLKFNGHNSLKISSSGYTANKWNGVHSNLTRTTNLTKGTVFFISCWYYCSDPNTFDASFTLELKGRGTGDSVDSRAGSCSITKTNMVKQKWTRIYSKVTLQKDFTTLYIYPWVEKNGTINVTDIMVSQSDILQDWCASADDVQSQISNVVQRVSTAEQKITADAIVSTVTTSDTYKNDLKGKVDTKTYNSYTEQTAKDISSKVSSSDFKTYKKQTATEISSKVTKSDFGTLITQNSDSVKVAFGNVGNGENLVRNSAGFLGTNNWYWWSSSDNAKFDTYNDGWLHIYNDTNSERCIAQGIYVNPNTTYTLSINVVTYNSTGCDVFIGGGTDSNNSWKYSRQVVNNYKGSVKTFKYTFTTKSDEKYITLRVDNNGVASGNDHRISFSGLKLEYGDKATPWCAHREEINNASVKMDNTGVEVLNGSITCKKGNNFTLVKDGCIGFAEQTPNGYEETAVIHNVYSTNNGQYINGVELDMLGKGDYIGIGYTDTNYNDSISNFSSSKSLIQFRNPKWGKYASEQYPIHVFGSIKAYANTFDIGTLKAISLDVSTTKHRVLETQYGKIGMNAVESCDALFEDVGDGKTDENGECIITLDAVFAETISLDIMYQVFLQKCGEGDLYVAEREENYFVVKGTPNLTFCWEIKARQKGYSKDRYIDVDSRESENKAIDIKEYKDIEDSVDSLLEDEIITSVDDLLKGDVKQ